MFNEKRFRGLFLNCETFTHGYFERLCSKNNIDQDLIRSAVLIPIIQEEHGMKILLTHRSSRLEDHASQISFPGGRIDNGDITPQDTAIRETYEEIGINKEFIEVLGNLDVYATATGFRIIPIVGLIKDNFNLKVNPREVDSIFYLPYDYLMDKKNHKKNEGTYTKQSKSYKYGYNVIPYQNHYIWGATAGMLINLYQLLK